MTKLEKLEKENKELRKSIKSWNENVGNLLKEITKLKKALLIDNFENMFINCKLTPLPDWKNCKMTSKKALEKISWRYVNDPSFQEWCNIIKQDLDQLEKENLLLKQIIYENFDIHDKDVSFVYETPVMEDEIKKVLQNFKHFIKELENE